MFNRHYHWWKFLRQSYQKQWTNPFIIYIETGISQSLRHFYYLIYKMTPSSQFSNFVEINVRSRLIFLVNPDSSNNDFSFVRSSAILVSFMYIERWVDQNQLSFGLGVFFSIRLNSIDAFLHSIENQEILCGESLIIVILTFF